MAEELSDTLDTLISQPKSVTAAGESVVNQNVADVVQADNAAANKKIAKKPWRALGFVKVISPGANL